MQPCCTAETAEHPTGPLELQVGHEEKVPGAVMRVLGERAAAIQGAWGVPEVEYRPILLAYKLSLIADDLHWEEEGPAWKSRIQKAAVGGGFQQWQRQAPQDSTATERHELLYLLHRVQVQVQVRGSSGAKLVELQVSGQESE